MKQHNQQSNVTSIRGKTDLSRHVYLIDTSIYIFKYYFSTPERFFSTDTSGVESLWQTDDGYSTETVMGFTRWLLKLLMNTQPQRIAACFDESLGSCFRNTLFEDYKSSRADPDEDLIFQLEACKQVCMMLGVPVYASQRYEADDLIASLAASAARQHLPSAIISRDKDLAQILSHPHDILWHYPDDDPLYKEDIVEKLGVGPDQVAEFLALTGDISDDIPGVPGIGSKTAAKILSQHGSWAEIKKQINTETSADVIVSPRIHDLLIKYQEQIDLSLKLTTLEKNAPLEKIIDTPELIDLYQDDEDQQQPAPTADAESLWERDYVDLEVLEYFLDELKIYRPLAKVLDEFADTLEEDD